MAYPWKSLDATLFAEVAGAQSGLVIGGRVELSQALKRGEDLVADLGLYGNQVEGGHAARAAAAHALGPHFEELPVEVEALLRTHERAGEDPGD